MHVLIIVENQAWIAQAVMLLWRLFKLLRWLRTLNKQAKTADAKATSTRATDRDVVL
eukprot:m.365962 g.365962  ORF g.365962 m.365962 type:complete len:57 (-) comp33986_c0_seq1:125-295(-)